MPAQKKKNRKLSMVPRKTAADYTFESIRQSIRTAETTDNHYRYGFYAERDANITHNWESLPIYKHGDHSSKRELFKNFRKAVNKVF